MQYRRLWLFNAPCQLGAYYYVSTYIITVTRPGLLSACALNQMLWLEHVWEVTIGTRNRTMSLLWPSNVRRLCCPREPNKKELGTCPTTVPLALSKATAFSIMRVSCFLSNLYNLSCFWSPYPFESMVASDHTFVKKNRVVWHWGACHLCSCRSTFTINHTFDYHVLSHAGRGYNNATC